MYQIELQSPSLAKHPNPSLGQSSHQEASKHQHHKAQRESHIIQRKKHPLVLYILVVIMQLLTIFLSLLLLVVPAANKPQVYITYIVMTCVRVPIFFYNSYYFLGFTKKLLALYFLMDNILVVMIASVIAYIFLNSLSTVQYVLGAMICYPFLLFFLCGNTRVMLVYCDWKPWEVMVYKGVKIIGATYFLIYGCYILTESEVANQEIFLLYVFTTCAFWGEMTFAVNVKDETDRMGTAYKLMDLVE